MNNICGVNVNRNHKKKRDKGVKSVALLPSQNTPFSLFNHCLGCLFTHSQPPFPFFQW